MELREQAHSNVAKFAIKLARRHRLLRMIREEEAASLSTRLGLRVLYGPCEGLNLLPSSSWGKSDLPLKVLGVYEQPLIPFIERVCPVETVVCIGAADGYYGIGLVVSGRASRSICFELTEAVRKTIAATARHNKVAEKIEILGKAEPEGLRSCLASRTCKSQLVIIDIEGGEFELLDAGVLAALSGAHVLIEMHPDLHANGQQAQRELLERAARHFDVEVVHDHGRIYPDVPELAELSDDQRCIILSEGRVRQMEWLLLTPRA